MEEHPRCAEPVAQHREPVREGCLFHLHEDLAAVGEHGVDALGVLLTIDRKGEIGELT
jgi:hypothetical protein